MQLEERHLRPMDKAAEDRQLMAAANRIVCTVKEAQTVLLYEIMQAILETAAIEIAPILESTRVHCATDLLAHAMLRANVIATWKNDHFMLDLDARQGENMIDYLANKPRRSAYPESIQR